MKQRRTEPTDRLVAARTKALIWWVMGFCAVGIALAVLSCLMSADVIAVTDSVRWVMIVAAVLTVMIGLGGGLFFNRKLLDAMKRAKDETRVLSDDQHGAADDAIIVEDSRIPSDNLDNHDAPEN